MVVNLQLADISRRMAQEANLLRLFKLTNREKLRLGIVLGCIKYGIRRISGGYDIVPSHLDLLGIEYGRLQLEQGRKLPIRLFLQQPEESQFFSLGPRNQNGELSVTLKPQALIPHPSRELRALLPNVDWDLLPPFQIAMINGDDKEEEAGDSALTTLRTSECVPHSLFKPKPRQVGSSPACCTGDTRPHCRRCLVNVSRIWQSSRWPLLQSNLVHNQYFVLSLAGRHARQ